MLAPVLAVRDPYAAATLFCQAGWKLESETSRQGPQPRACVSLALSRVHLVADPGASDPDDTVPNGRTQPSRPGIELELHVPPYELSGLFLLHRAAGVAVSDLRNQPSGERGFRALICGYAFWILGGDPDPDLAAITTDPRIAALADGLRQRDGDASLIDSGLGLVESSGQSVGLLRRALAAGLPDAQRLEVGQELAEVVVAAATLARQLGLDLDRQIDRRLGGTNRRPR
ncbi:MAG TPA: hypothetical protein VIT20_09890 [Propionibacteriaceae bacterium]